MYIYACVYMHLNIYICAYSSRSRDVCWRTVDLHDVREAGEGLLRLGVGLGVGVRVRVGVGVRVRVRDRGL